MSGNLTNFSRMGEHFVPHLYDKPVTVIGAGATGSFVILELAKMGVKDITVYDFDVIEEHNVANQVYAMKHIGMNKVDAIADIVKEQTGADITAINEKVDGSTYLKGVVFCLTDSMASRKEIWERAVRFKPQINMYIETRMGINVGYIYTINPMSAVDVNKYPETLYGDDVAETSTCGSSLSIVTTACTIASMACWNVVRDFKGVHTPQEVLFDLENLNIFNTTWEV